MSCFFGITKAKKEAFIKAYMNTTARVSEEDLREFFYDHNTVAEADHIMDCWLLWCDGFEHNGGIMKKINVEMSLEQFLSLKALLLYVLDNEQDSYDEYVEECGDMGNHIYSYALSVSEALT